MFVILRAVVAVTVGKAAARAILLFATKASRRNLSKAVAYIGPQCITVNVSVFRRGSVIISRIAALVQDAGLLLRM